MSEALLAKLETCGLHLAHQERPLKSPPLSSERPLVSSAEGMIFALGKATGLFPRTNTVTYLHLRYSVWPACMTCWVPFKLSSGPFNFELELDPGKQILEMHYLQITFSVFLSHNFSTKVTFHLNLLAQAKMYL